MLAPTFPYPFHGGFGCRTSSRKFLTAYWPFQVAEGRVSTKNNMVWLSLATVQARCSSNYEL